jgi:hypothetical protein
MPPRRIAPSKRMLVLSVVSAVLMLVRTFCAVQRIMGMIAIHVLVKMSMLVGVGVRMRMDDLAMPVFMSVDMRMGMFVLMLVGMAVGSAVRVTVIAVVHVMSP